MPGRDAASPPITRRLILSNALALTIGSALAQGLMAVTVLLTARQLGVMSFGQYTATFSVAAFTSVLFNLGLDTWLLRSGAREQHRLGELLGNALIVKLLLGSVWLAGLVLILPRLNPGTFVASLVCIAGIAILGEGLLSAMLSAFKALLRTRVPVWAMIGLRGTILVLTALLVALGAKNLAGYALIRLIVAAAVAGIVLRLLPFTLRARTRAWPGMGRETLPFAASDLAASVYLQADTTLAAIMLGSAAVGLYAPASSLVNALFVIPAALYTLMIPVLVRTMDARGRLPGRMIVRSLGSFALLGVVLWAGTSLASGRLLTFLLGDAFKGSGVLLAILSPILFLKSVNFGAAAVLVAVGWQGRRVYVQAAAAGLNVALNLAVIPRFGVIGVAWVYVISELCLLLGYLGLVAAWMVRQRRRGDSLPDEGPERTED
jgi:O-antigen/teichoic acid export membrane protein